MTTSLTAMPVHKSILVHASPEDAFDVFTEDVDSWWPRTHHIGKMPMRRVLACDPPRRIVLAWQITHEWGYQPDLAQSSEVEVRFTPLRGGSTQVDLEHRFIERHGAGGEAMRTAVGDPNGWTAILNLFSERVNARATSPS